MLRLESPYQRFSVLLALFLLAGTALVGITAAWRIQALLTSETAEGTYDSVNRHLRLFDLTRWLQANAPLDDQHDHGGYPTLQSKDAMIRLHFDIYDIQYAAIFDRSGHIRYSYRPNEVGGLARPENAGVLAAGLQGKRSVDSSDMWQGLFTVVVPVEGDTPGSAPVGAVLVVRDVSALMKMIRTIQWLVAGVMALVAAVLFFALSRVFLRATTEIRTKTRDLEQVIALVESTYDATLKALTAALDFRDTETEGHSQRVTAYTVRLAHEMGITGTALLNVTRGALLHDVGKIGIPDSVLRKPGGLTPEEWTMMRRHPSMGYAMLQAIEFLRPALPVVLHHQERFDGSGYPAGLSGTEIPLAARIFAVCDTLDAICSDRPYRKGRTYAEARQEIVTSASTQFDPGVVAAFERIPESDWLAIREGVDQRLSGVGTVAAF